MIGKGRGLRVRLQISPGLLSLHIFQYTVPLICEEKIMKEECINLENIDMTSLSSSHQDSRVTQKRTLYNLLSKVQADLSRSYHNFSDIPSEAKQFYLKVEPLPKVLPMHVALVPKNPKMPSLSHCSYNLIWTCTVYDV